MLTLKRVNGVYTVTYKKAGLKLYFGSLHEAFANIFELQKAFKRNGG